MGGELGVGCLRRIANGEDVQLINAELEALGAELARDAVEILAPARVDRVRALGRRARDGPAGLGEPVDDGLRGARGGDRLRARPLGEERVQAVVSECDHNVGVEELGLIGIDRD